MDKAVLNLLEDADKRQHLKRLIEEFEALDSSAKPVGRPQKGTKKGTAKRQLSAAGRRNIAKAQKKRWAKVKAGKKSPAKKAASKKSAKQEGD